MTTRLCKFCKESYTAKTSENRIYCSQTCYFADRNAQRTRNCGHCGKEFLASHVGRERQVKYCSRLCYGLAQRTPRVLLTCPHCGKEFTRRPSEIRDANFCSYACRAYELSVGKTIGIKLHQDSKPSPYTRPYWIRQAYRARKRDGYKCQDCGRQFAKGDGKLHVHHKIPLRLNGSDHLSNLISLCAKCHKKADNAIQAEERRNWPPGVPRPKNVRHKPLPNHCKNGHEFTPENTVSRKDNNGRRCLTCQREGAKRKYARTMADPKKRERLNARQVRRQVEKRDEIRAYSKAYGRKKTEARQVERALRPDACKKGHLFTPENTMPRSDGGKRRCRTCYQARQSAARARVNADPILVQKRREYHSNWRQQNKLKNQSAQASLF